jgi:hypothetical protein
MKTLSLARHHDVTGWGWTGGQLLARLIALDHKHVPGMDDTDEGTVSQWSPVFMQHPHTWSLLVDPARLPSLDAVVGYWSFCTLRPEAFEVALQGMLNDSDITSECLQPITGPGEYDAYIVMFVIEEAHRRQGAVMMVRSFFDNLLALAQQGIFVRRLCTNAFTAAGTRLSREVLRLDPLVPHSKRGHIFARAFFPATDDMFPPSFSALDEIYRAHRPQSATRVRFEEALSR